MHLQTEAVRRAYADRNAFLGDPDFVSMPVGRLLAKWYAATLRAGIDPHHATPTVPVGGTRSEGPETTHFSIVDPDGNAISCTTTLNNDSERGHGDRRRVPPERRDGRFHRRPGAPESIRTGAGEANAIAPGKRMLSP